MLLFAKNNKQVATLCMGEDGAITRILSPVFGSLFNYTYTDRQTAPGQISLHELMSIYNYARLQPSTQLFGLIGDPVEQSIGHIVHNAAAKALEWDAVYVKMRITQEELPEFFTLATQCGFKGLSVTSPLKEKIFPHKAINTLVWKEDKVQGYNTDGTGCLDALELHTSVYKKRIMILGAGGAAQAIAKEACARGALVTLYNRSKAQAVANKIGCFASERVENYDILINATSSLVPISSDAIIPGSYVMDIHTTPALPPLLIEAKKRGAPSFQVLRCFYIKVHSNCVYGLRRTSLPLFFVICIRAGPLLKSPEFFFKKSDRNPII